MTDGPEVVIDTDTFNEIDDQFAVAHAWLSAEMNLRALYAAPFLNARSQSPGDGMEKSYEELERLIPMLPAWRVPALLRGSTRFMSGQPSEESPAVRDLIERALAHDLERKLQVIAIGAPTNVANALLIEPAIADRTHIIWLGGHALHWPTTDEFNMRQDVIASRTILQTNAQLTLVPCFGVASELITTLPELEASLTSSELNHFLKRRFEETRNSMFAYGRALWDVAATAVLACPEGIEADEVAIPHLSDDLVWETRSDQRVATVVRRVNRNRILEDLFTKLNTIES